MTEYTRRGKFGHPPFFHPKTQKSKPDLQVWIFEIMTWQECAEGFQTFELQDDLKAKQDIQEIRALLDEDKEEQETC